MEYEDNWKPEVQFESYWTFLVLTALQIEDNRHWPAFGDLSSPPSANKREPRPFNGAKVPLEAYTWCKKSCHRNQTRDFGARNTVEYDSALSQQSISGEIVRLTLCAWKPGFLKSGHNFRAFHKCSYILYTLLFKASKSGGVSNKVSTWWGRTQYNVLTILGILGHGSQENLEFFLR